MIAGLAAYVAIHSPFWAWDFIRKRWRRGGGDGESPRHARRLKRCGWWWVLLLGACLQPSALVALCMPSSAVALHHSL